MNRIIAADEDPDAQLPHATQALGTGQSRMFAEPDPDQPFPVDGIAVNTPPPSPTPIG